MKVTQKDQYNFMKYVFRITTILAFSHSLKYTGKYCHFDCYLWHCQRNLKSNHYTNRRLFCRSRISSLCSFDFDESSDEYGAYSPHIEILNHGYDFQSYDVFSSDSIRENDVVDTKGGMSEEQSFQSVPSAHGV